MTTETITRIKLTASDGMMLTDGETYGKEVFLAENADPKTWHEITQKEYDELMAQEEQESEPDVADSI